MLRHKDTKIKDWKCHEQTKIKPGDDKHQDSNKPRANNVNVLQAKNHP